MIAKTLADAPYTCPSAGGDVNAISSRGCAGKMLCCAVSDVRHAPVGDYFRQTRRNLIEMQMLEQLKAGRTQDVGILQHLYGVPVTALNQQWQRRSRDSDQNGFLSGK